jgi:hypothetical protein
LKQIVHATTTLASSNPALQLPKNARALAVKQRVHVCECIPEGSRR